MRGGGLLCQGRRLCMLELNAFACTLFLALPLDSINLFVGADLDMTEEAGYLMLQIGEQFLKQSKRLALVLLLGILACITAQENALS